jgi:hypothetical protein
MRLPLSTEFLTHTLHNSQKLQHCNFDDEWVLLILFSRLQMELCMSSLRGFSLSKVERRKKRMCFPRSLSSSPKLLAFDLFLLFLSTTSPSGRLTSSPRFSPKDACEACHVLCSRSSPKCLNTLEDVLCLPRLLKA